MEISDKNEPSVPSPRALDLKKDSGLMVTWQDGTSDFFPIGYLRKHSPSADMKALREEMAKNPLTVLPASALKSSGPLTATGAELVGNYAIKIHFSDGHDTGLYSWDYLKSIVPPKKS